MTCDDITAEKIKVFAESTVSVMKIVEDLNDPVMSLKLLSAVAAFILCYRASNEDAAHEMMSGFIDDIDDAVLLTKNHGVTAWAEGTPH